jgi:hypothetical protein
MKLTQQLLEVNTVLYNVPVPYISSIPVSHTMYSTVQGSFIDIGYPAEFSIKT